MRSGQMLSTVRPGGWFVIDFLNAEQVRTRPGPDGNGQLWRRYDRHPTRAHARRAVRSQDYHPARTADAFEERVRLLGAGRPRADDRRARRGGSPAGLVTMLAAALAGGQPHHPDRAGAGVSLRIVTTPIDAPLTLARAPGRRDRAQPPRGLHRRRRNGRSSFDRLRDPATPWW